MKRLILPIILLAGFVLRVWGIDADLPHPYYGDESYLIYHTLKFGSGDLNPHWFTWPTLFQYSLFFLYGLYFVAGKLIGTFDSSADFLYQYLKDPTAIFLIARAFSVLLGTVTLGALYYLGRVIYGRRVGYLAAGILAVVPLHVSYSHFAVTDGPMTFMLITASIFIVRFFKKGTAFSYGLAGFFIGLATATKYPAFILVVSAATAHFLRIRGERAPLFKVIFDKRVISLAIFLVLGFFIGCPFAFLDYSNFLSGMRAEYAGQRMGWFGWEEANSYVYHITNTLRNALGAPLLIVSIAGLIRAVLRRTKEETIFLPLVFGYYFILCRSFNTYDRFMLPLVPFLALFASKLFFEIRDRAVSGSRTAGYASYIFLIAILAVPASRSIEADKRLTLPSTRTLANRWVEDNIPQGSRLLINEFGPPLLESPDQIRDQFLQKADDAQLHKYYAKRGIFYR
ncbi:MAG: glycosyltransferase family 39 protein, partial [Candidatus Omnitrophota bacterium]